jgi:hypothetical protein
MIEWYPWIVLAHVIGAFGFVFAHGASAFAAFRMRSDRRPESVAAMLGVSSTGLTVMYPSLLLLLVGGIWAAFAQGLWDRPWIWASLVLLLGVSTAMYLVGTRFYIRVRHAVGINAPQDGKDGVPVVPVSGDELAALLASRQPEALAAIGGVGLGLILWLMVVKPG